MATITSLRTEKEQAPLRSDGGVQYALFEIALSTDLNNADVVDVVELPAGVRIVEASMSISGTLGASCTAQLRQGTTAITAATTAGGADFETMNVHPPAATADGDTVNILIGGADVGTAATAKVKLGYILA